MLVQNILNKYLQKIKLILILKIRHCLENRNHNFPILLRLKWKYPTLSSTYPASWWSAVCSFSLLRLHLYVQWTTKQNINKKKLLLKNYSWHACAFVEPLLEIGRAKTIALTKTIVDLVYVGFRKKDKCWRPYNMGKYKRV